MCVIHRDPSTTGTKFQNELGFKIDASVHVVRCTIYGFGMAKLGLSVYGVRAPIRPSHPTSLQINTLHLRTRSH